jgi:hypothetical protein
VEVVRNPGAFFEEVEAVLPFMREGDGEAGSGLECRDRGERFVLIAEGRLATDPRHVQGADGPPGSTDGHAKEGAHVGVAGWPARIQRMLLQVHDPDRAVVPDELAQQPTAGWRPAEAASIFVADTRVDEAVELVVLVEGGDGRVVGGGNVAGAVREAAQHLRHILDTGKQFACERHFVDDLGGDER